ncbi:hypothetical protein [Streptomyces sp. NPDC008001]|uniref:hypothetical protein n=1 Tax=Streptomyces sp. NPDC008001 TaxID=3364804 RepID=UPI0036EB6766
MVFAVSPLLREALPLLTNGLELRPDAQDRLRQVAVDEFVDVSEEALYLPEPADDRLRAVTDLFHAEPAAPSTLAELGRRHDNTTGRSTPVSTRGTEAHERTAVVIVGAGVTGLTVGDFLLHNGIDCAVLPL